MGSIPFHSGDVIGGIYRLGTVLGDGFSSCVYRATTLRAEPQDPLYAIKILDVSARSASFTERFRREMHMLMEVSHPHVVRFHDAGKQDGYPYIVLEFADGGSVVDLLRIHPVLPGDQAAWIVFQAICGLKAVRAVHRDLKPDNLLVSLGRGREGYLPVPGDPRHGSRIMVADWGLGRRGDTAPADGASLRLTSTYEIWGTAQFMSPEQCFSAKHAGYSGDIYSLGCLLYLLVCGRPPFDAAAAVDIFHQHFFQEPARPLGVSDPLWAVISRCLHKDPRQRFPGMRSLQEALRPLMGKDASWRYEHDPDGDLFDREHSSYRDQLGKPTQVVPM